MTANAIWPRAGARDAISQMDALKPELVAPFVVYLCARRATLGAGIKNPMPPQALKA